MGAPHLCGIGPQRRLHGQGGVTGPEGVIFVGYWGTKQGQDAVTRT